ncbi:MAG TPA: phosphoribosylamine--glycine ligase, partial [Candidatus Polarisedimenticolaceae bacterium]|nr:phosphoribosylamine--glycine ligase [Candidatus Polarisedimenticolaceae bacterium]
MVKQNILVIGSGGREHALAWKLAQSRHAGKLYIAPGNGGTHEVAESVAIAASDIDGLARFAKNNQIGLTVVGPDDALADGVVDAFRAAGLRAFGPTQAAARIESSKAFSKQLMAKRHIPTAEFVTLRDQAEALAYVDVSPLPVVIKASGLALGKGVYICRTLEEAKQAIQEIMGERRFGDSGNEIVIEQYLEGPEFTTHALSDGDVSVMFPASQDHKPINDGNTGPNTGGMGAYAPVPGVSAEQVHWVQKQVVSPVLDELAQAGSPFVGCLYPGMKMTKDGPKVIEFNARLGDPEAQVYMRLLESDLVEILGACIDGKVADLNIRWKPGFAVSVVLVSGGYPGEYKKGLPIEGLEEAAAQPDVTLFHAGTVYRDGGHQTAGGRVINVTATANSLARARDKAYAAVKLIHFEG